MVQQLTVYDENGAQIGMTFPKRARQLISKQRALWHDDTHNAIRLLPETKEEAPLDEYLDDDMEETTGFMGSDDLLLYLAKKSVREKRNLIKHVLAYLATWPVIIIFYEIVISNTRHPQHWQIGSINWQLDYIRHYMPYESLWAVNDIEWTMRSFSYSLTHPVMFVIIGAMVAWGGWILTRAVNRVITNYRGRAGRDKPDPVQLEYQRLKSIAR